MRAAEALKVTFGARALLRSLVVAAIVGSIVNLINQGVKIAHGHPVIVWKLALTYFVPFAVASYGSFAALRSQA